MFFINNRKLHLYEGLYEVQNLLYMILKAEDTRIIALLFLLYSIQRRDICEELVKSQKVFSEKLNHLSRRLAWINVTIYSKVRGKRICELSMEYLG